jgi:hypothetical protein
VLAILLVVSLAGVGLKTYWLWQEGPWDLPRPVKPKRPADRDDRKVGTKAGPVMLSTEVIVAKNLFDPERGAGRTKDAEADSRATQRIRSMILLGTAILGSSRFAIVQDGDGASRPGAPAAPQAPRRIKLGDSVEGFSLAEVGEKRVVFAKGATRVELPIDYFRKVPVATLPSGPQPRQPAAPRQVAPGVVPGQVPPGTAPGQVAPPGVVPRVVPNLPRRPRLPTPPEQ